MRPKKEEKLPEDLLKETIKSVVLCRDPKKFKNEFELLVSGKEFQKDIKKIREEWGVNLDEEQLIESSNEALDKLIKKYKLTKEWEYILSMYICTNEFEKMGDPHGITISVSPNKEYANVKIYPETTLTEIKQAYKRIRELLKDGKISEPSPGRSRGSPRFVQSSSSS